MAHENICAICYEDDEPAKQMKFTCGCSKLIHQECIDRWHKVTSIELCPVCGKEQEGSLQCATIVTIVGATTMAVLFSR